MTTQAGLALIMAASDSQAIVIGLKEVWSIGQAPEIKFEIRMIRVLVCVFHLEFFCGKLAMAIRFLVPPQKNPIRNLCQRSDVVIKNHCANTTSTSMTQSIIARIFPPRRK
jgi:hypothetical protein